MINPPICLSIPKLDSIHSIVLLLLFFFSLMILFKLSIFIYCSLPIYLTFLCLPRIFFSMYSTLVINGRGSEPTEFNWGFHVQIS